MCVAHPERSERHQTSLGPVRHSLRAWLVLRAGLAAAFAVRSAGDELPLRGLDGLRCPSLLYIAASYKRREGRRRRIHLAEQKPSSQRAESNSAARFCSRHRDGHARAAIAIVAHRQRSSGSAGSTSHLSSPPCAGARQAQHYTSAAQLAPLRRAAPSPANQCVSRAPPFSPLQTTR